MDLCLGSLRGPSGIPVRRVCRSERLGAAPSAFARLETRAEFGKKRCGKKRLGRNVTRVTAPRGLFCRTFFCRFSALEPAAARRQHAGRHPDTANPRGPLPVTADPQPSLLPAKTCAAKRFRTPAIGPWPGSGVARHDLPGRWLHDQWEERAGSSFPCLHSLAPTCRRYEKGRYSLRVCPVSAVSKDWGG